MRLCPSCGTQNTDDTLEACLKCETLLPRDTRDTDAAKTTPPPPGISLPDGREPRLPLPDRDELLGGRYELLQLLGEGGMGMVYRARDIELDEELAIKLLQRQFTENPEDIERFKREIKTARRITHRNVIRIHHFAVAGREAYICMELLGGGTLADRIYDEPIPIAEGVRIAVQIADGLGAAHRLGVVHRDIKPHNVMFDEFGTIKVLDFGIARFTASTSHTKGFVGTPHYVSPEQADGRPATLRSDVYSLGILLFELFTGKPPFASNSLAQLILAHVSKEPPKPRSIRSELPAALERLILKCLEKNPRERYADANELAQALRDIATEQTWQIADTNIDAGAPSPDLVAGRYRITDTLSPHRRFRARDIDAQRDVTIRIVDEDAVGDVTRILDRFKDLEHPNIARVVDFVEDDGDSYIVTDHVEGQTLGERLERTRVMPVGWAMRIMRDVTAGLEAVHRAGVVHGALTPDNVYLAFGSDQALIGAYGVTHDTVRTDDIHALGALAFLLVVGEEPADYEEAKKRVPPELGDFVSACLHPDPAQRPQDASAARTILDMTGSTPRPLRVRVDEQASELEEDRPSRVSKAIERDVLDVRVRIRWVYRIAVAIIVLGLLALIYTVAARQGWFARRATPGTPEMTATVLLERFREESGILPGERDGMMSRIRNELHDAWGITAEITETTDSRRAIPTVRGRVFKKGKQIHLTLADPEAELVDYQARLVAEQAAKRIALAQPGPPRPTLEDLRRAGTESIGAWRRWRRAMRANLMERPAYAHELLTEAIKKDDGFGVAYMERAFTFQGADASFKDDLAKARVRMDQQAELDEVYRISLEVGEVLARGANDQAIRDALANAAQRLRGGTLTPSQKFYAKMHIAMTMVESDPSTDKGMAELIALARDTEQAAPAKFVARARLGSAIPVNLPQALKYSEIAVRSAPEDVGAWALRARALTLDGKNPVAELAMLDTFATAELQADPELLFHLRMGRNEIEDARELIDTGSGTFVSRLLANTGLAFLEMYQRGAYKAQLTEMKKVAATYRKLGAPWDAHERFWALGHIAYNLGLFEDARDAFRECADVGERPAMCNTMAKLSEIRVARPDPRSPVDGTAAQNIIDDNKIPRNHDRAHLELHINSAAHDWDRVLANFGKLTTDVHRPVYSLYFAGVAYEGKGDPTKARELYDEMANRSPSAWLMPVLHANSLAALARLDEKDNPESALKYAREFMEHRSASEVRNDRPYQETVALLERLQPE